MLTREIPGDGLLIHSSKRYVGRRCRCEDCWGPRYSRGSGRIARRAAKRRERQGWMRDQEA